MAFDGLGVLQVGIYNSPGQLWEFELFEGDAGFAPRGSGHWILNTGWIMATAIFCAASCGLHICSHLPFLPLELKYAKLQQAACMPRLQMTAGTSGLV